MAADKLQIKEKKEAKKQEAVCGIEYLAMMDMQVEVSQIGAEPPKPICPASSRTKSTKKKPETPKLSAVGRSCVVVNML